MSPISLSVLARLHAASHQARARDFHDDDLATAAINALPTLLQVAEAAQRVLDYLEQDGTSAVLMLCDEPVCDFSGCVERRALRAALDGVEP